ncbi:MAG: glycosyltransferase family 4 protein [Anaerolineae bacterium]|nr:glycosyltransferase family 4 protein [Anaerolineae bacterium]
MAQRNLLFISSYTGLGGGESAILNLFGALDRDRFALHLLTPGDGIYPRAARAAGVQTHVIPYRPATVYFVPAVWARFPIAGKLARFIRAHDIDLVHSDYHALPYAFGATRRAKLPSPLVGEGPGVRGTLPLLWTCMGWWFKPKAWQRAFFRRIDRIVAISHAVKAGFLGDPPALPPEAVEVIWLGVDPEKFRPEVTDPLGRALRAELGIAPDAPVVSMLGRFQYVKGYEYFFEAMRAVAQAVPEARFIVGGENMQGPPADRQYRERMLKWVAEDPLLAPRVCYAGYRAHAGQVIAAADVMVCASLFESFGMVHVESMACRRPVVSTNAGAPPELIVDGATGCLAPPRRPDLLAEKVLYLLARPGLRAQMGAAGRARVLEQFTVARYAARFAAVVEDLLDVR